MKLLISIDENELAEYLSRQMNLIFPSKDPVNSQDLFEIQRISLQRLEYCFSKVNIKYFFDGKNTIFNHLNGDQYSMYLYLMSYTAYKHFNNVDIAAKSYLLNKTLHGIDAFYEVELPDVFVFIHPLGTVLGRASYKDFLVVYQRCGIGSNNDCQPDLGKYLTLHPGASILGKSVVGDNCSIASDSLLIDMTIPDNQTYIGNPKANHLIERDDISEIWKL